jgi:hypothetical protein
MKKAVKVVALILFLAFSGIQFVRPARINVPVVREQALEGTTQVPEGIQEIFRKSCNDCHTNQTDWRWYSQIAPMSWGMVEHVEDGRRNLNFSEWGSYETRRKRKKLEEICEQLESREMPLDQYVWLHWNARLSDAEIKSVCEWTETERAKLAASETAPKQ